MSDPIEAAQKLTSALDGMSERLEAVSARLDEQGQYGRRNRRLIRWLVLSLALDALLTGAFAFGAVKVNEANTRTVQVHNQQVATCQSGNEARQLNVKLWDYVLSAAASRPLTAERKKQIDDFKAFVHTTFAPRDCSKI